MKISLLVLLGALTLASAQNTPMTSASSDIMTPDAILKKAQARYASLETYSSQGTVVADMGMSGTKLQTVTTFSIKLKKPNLYLITWSQTGAMPQGMVQSGTVWSEGTQPYLLMGQMNAYSKISGDEMALAAATGISSGAAFTVPALFFPALLDKGALLSGLKDPTIEKSEQIDGDDCYVVSGSSPMSKKETFWISKSSSLIRKFDRSLEQPMGGASIPAASDADLEKALRSMGQPVTDEALQKMRKMAEDAQKTLKKGGSSGSFVETQMDISSPAFTANDFHFTPPSDATLKDSLFGEHSGVIKAPAGPAGTTSSYETVTAPVLKVFSAADGKNKFVAYLVKWKDAEVVVSDPLARTSYKVGDSLKFMAQKIDVSQSSSLSFVVLD